MADLIDKQALLGRLDDIENSMIWDAQSCALLFAFRKFINSAAAVDAVEVVRCGECKHWEAHCNGKAGICPKRKGVARADDFCGYGERREENAADKC